MKNIDEIQICLMAFGKYCSIVDDELFIMGEYVAMEPDNFLFIFFGQLRLCSPDNKRNFALAVKKALLDFKSYFDKNDRDDSLYGKKLFYVLHNLSNINAKDYALLKDNYSKVIRAVESALYYINEPVVHDVEPKDMISYALSFARKDLLPLIGTQELPALQAPDPEEPETKISDLNSVDQDNIISKLFLPEKTNGKYVCINGFTNELHPIAYKVAALTSDKIGRCMRKLTKIIDVKFSTLQTNPILKGYNYKLKDSEQDLIAQFIASIITTK